MTDTVSEEDYVVLSSYVDDTEDEYRLSLTSYYGGSRFVLTIDSYYVTEAGDPCFDVVVLITPPLSAADMKSRIKHFTRCLQLQLGEAVEAFITNSKLLNT